MACPEAESKAAALRGRGGLDGGGGAEREGDGGGGAERVGGGAERVGKGDGGEAERVDRGALAVGCFDRDGVADGDGRGTREEDGDAAERDQSDWPEQTAASWHVGHCAVQEAPAAHEASGVPRAMHGQESAPRLTAGERAAGAGERASAELSPYACSVIALKAACSRQESRARRVRGPDQSLPPHQPTAP